MPFSRASETSKTKAESRLPHNDCNSLVRKEGMVEQQLELYSVSQAWIGWRQILAHETVPMSQLLD